MMNTIRKCAVIGAGTMGAGIAAHLANAGADVVLLDLDADVARQGVERQIKVGGFMQPGFASRVRTGSTGADMALLADRDWIIEAVAERLDIKRALYAAIAAVRPPGCLLSSNTSTIPLADLVEGLAPELAAHTLITHFFNPPRQMRLLELVTGPGTDPVAAARVCDFIDHALGKAIVPCKDTPGFIANRIGCFWLGAGLGEALRLGIGPEAGDAVMGKPFGLPRTGVFGLYDLIGLDLMPGLLRSLQAHLPASDAVHGYAAEPEALSVMLAQGLKGRKSGGGFYRQTADRKGREVYDTARGAYRPAELPPTILADPRALMEQDSAEGRYALAVMGRTLAYAAALVPAIADRPDLVDEAMRLGYGWAYGPFELIDRIGADWLAQRLDAEGLAVPPLLRAAAGAGGFYRVAQGRRSVLSPVSDGFASLPVPQREGVVALPALRLASRPVWSDEAASLWDTGDGVGLLEFHTKFNVFTPALLAAVEQVIARVPRDFRALVVANDGPVFSAGADLKAMLAMAEARDRAGLVGFMQAGLAAFATIRHAPFPVVGACGALAVGGGCEVLLHTHALALHAEARIGLVESRVGLLPGWGGVAQWLLRHQQAGLDADASGLAVFDGVLAGIAAPGAHAALARHLLRPTDAIVMNADRVIAGARKLALALPAGAPVAEQVHLPTRAVLEAHLAARREALSPHDATIAAVLADVLAGDGGAITLDALSQRVAQAFADLALTRPSQLRMRHMIETGKPLTN